MPRQKPGKNSKAAKVSQLISGAKKHFPNGSQTVSLEGVSTTIDAATQELQTYVDNRSAVVAAQATAKVKLATERAALPALDAFISAFIALVRLTFGTQADILVDFGLAPRKARTPQTAEAKAVAVAKREATRAARGTKGPKAKSEIHGNVTAKLVVTPAGEPAPTPEAPAAPAAAPVDTSAPSDGVKPQATPAKQ
ncbi:MAG TPA: hypothetical protein VF765_11310 [Polyangiaceae bacterium]